MHSKLGSFIRTHREHIKPQDIGLHVTGSRRTPGLRREELAQLCGVSPTWLTWLEQGRPVSASVKVLDKLADVMRLTPAERAYLFRLADRLDPREPAAQRATIDADAIVGAIDVPAYMLDRQWDVVAWNKSAATLFTGWLDKRTKQVPQPNLLQFTFLSPAARTLITNWPERAQRLVAEFRADCGKATDEEPLVGMIEQLRQGSEEFDRLWNSQQVVGRDGGLRQFMHPKKGELRYEQVTFNVASSRGHKLVMLLPT